MIHLGFGDAAFQQNDATESETAEPTATPDQRSSLAALADRLQIALNGRFQVLEPIALGGMATLFRLEHTVHGGHFVAKLLRAELVSRPEIVRSFRAEAVHAARLGGHPNAVAVFDFGTADGLPFLIMPFVEGEDLDRLLESSGPFSRAEALHCTAQISSLLCYAESYGITHCDLAPGNIRLDIFGRYRVLDLGISVCSADEGAHHALGGTPLYSSPEQLRGEILDIRSDIYSLGLILAELLTGKPLMQAESLNLVRRKHLDGDWQVPPALEADFPIVRLLRTMLATDRSARLSSAFELSGALAALGFERPEFRQRPTTTSVPEPDSARRRRRLSAS